VINYSLITFGRSSRSNLGWSRAGLPRLCWQRLDWHRTAHAAGRLATTFVAALGTLACGASTQTGTNQSTVQPVAASVLLGHLGPGCKRHGAATSDVWLKAGLVTDTAALQAGTGTLVVRLQDIRTLSPLAGGRVSLARPNLRPQTQSDSLARGAGSFEFRGIPAGIYHLETRLVGYVAVGGAVEIRPGKSDTLTVAINNQGNVYGDIGCD